MTDRTVVYRLRAEASQFQAQMSAASASVTDAARKMTAANAEGEKFRRGLTTVGDTAGKVGLVAAAGLGAAVKAAVDWESAWAGVTKTVDGSSSQMAELEEGLRGLAKTLPATHEEIAGVAEAAGQLGVAREDILDFTKTMVDLGETTNLTAEDAATNIAQIANVMGTTGDEVDNFGAALVALGNAGASTESQILDMTQRIAGAGAQIGLAETDILAIANAAASMGIEAEAGGSAISRVFTELAKATASGGPKLEQFAQIAGMTAEEFVNAFGEDPAQAFNEFTKGLDRVNQSGGDVFTTLKSLGLSDVRVSQALLGMAASGDLLTDSLELGKQAWEENTALAMEAAKRYDTTASQTQIAWNRIKDAGIDAGESLLPVVAGVAESVGSLADAFGSLPGPVKNSLSGLLGITAVFGGGLWFTAKVVNGVTSMKGALDDLGISGDKASGAMGKVSRAATIAGASLAAMAVVDTLQRQFEGLDTGLEGVTGQLLKLGEADGGALSGEFNDIADSFDRLTDPNKAQAFQDSIYDTMGFLGSDSRVDKAVAQFEAIDAGLTNITATAGSGAAEQVFDALAESMSLSADEQERLLELMPQYTDALAGAENQAALKAVSDEEAAAAAAELGAAAIASADEIKAQEKALEDARDAARETAQGFFNLGDGLNDAKVSLGDWIKQMADQAAALRNFRKNAEEAANKGLRQGLINALREAGPEGALRMRQLANATDAEIRRANKAWQSGQAEIRKYVGETTKVPKNVSTTVQVDTAAASQRIASINAQLAAIDRNIVVNVGIRGGGGGEAPYLSGGTRRASGGPVYGPGTATSDSIPAYLSNGEYVIKAAAVEKYGVHTFDRLNAMHFAEGGKVERRKVRAGAAFYAEDNTAALQRAIDRLAMVAEDQTAAVEDQTRRTDEWAKRMADVAQATVSGFNTGLFDRDSNVWAAGSGGGALANLTRDIAGLQERGGLQSQLAGMGLSGDALAALLAQGSNADISALIQSGQATQYAALFNQRAALQGSVGAAAGQFAFGAEFAAQSKELQAATAAQQETAQTIRKMERQLERTQAALERMERNAPERTGAEVGRAINSGASKGHQDKKNRTGVKRG